MKKLFYSAFIFAAMLTSCEGAEASTNQEETTEATNEQPEVEVEVEVEEVVSTKGNWTQEEIEKAEAELEKVDASLEPFGDKKEDFKSCYLTKIMENYDNFNQANMDLEGCTALAETCTKQVLGN